MGTPSTHPGKDRDLAQMERWVAWVMRLLSHAAELATEESSRARLEGALEDARSLREALSSAASGWLDQQQVEVLHSVYDLWDANHDRNERLAALVDPPWHREWRMRSAGARPEHDVPADEPLRATAGT